MTIKQGIEVTDAGRGALSSGYDVVIKLAQVASPMLWGCARAQNLQSNPRATLTLWVLTRRCCHTALFTYFGNAPVDSWAGRVGPGGHMLVMAAMRFISLRLVSGIPAKELHLGEDD